MSFIFEGLLQSVDLLLSQQTLPPRDQEHCPVHQDQLLEQLIPGGIVDEFVTPGQKQSSED